MGETFSSRRSDKEAEEDKNKENDITDGNTGGKDKAQNGSEAEKWDGSWDDLPENCKTGIIVVGSLISACVIIGIIVPIVKNIKKN